MITLGDLPAPPPGKMGFPWTEGPAGLANSALPRISVVTPSYNQAAYLEETIRSVLLQGYSNLEYVIMDGGSTDGSIEIIKRYAAWLTHWVSEPDAGQSDAINKGWQYCTGDVFAWLNGDDVYAPNALTQVGETFADNSALGLVYGNILVSDSVGKQSGIIGYHAANAYMLAALEIPYQPASFFKASIVGQVGCLDVSLRYVMDVDILVRVMANAPMARINQPLASFRIHAQSKTNLGEAAFARELIGLAEKIQSHLVDYPGLAQIERSQTISNFHRLAAKHFYQGNCFRDALMQIILACRTNPTATLAILGDEGLGWLVRRLLPMRFYRALAHRLRAKPATQNF